MSIGFSRPCSEVKFHDPAAQLIFPAIEAWIPESLDRLLCQSRPPLRRYDLFSPSRMLRLELLQASRPDLSFQETLREVWQTWRCAGCVAAAFPVPSALPQARARLPLWPLTMLFKHTVAAACKVGHLPAWPFHRLLAIDGTPLDLANTPAQRTYFGTTRHQHGEAYFPKALGVWVSLIHPQTVVGEYLGTSREGDESVAPHLLSKVLQPGDLVLGDAHFGNYPTLAVVPTRQAFYLVRAAGPFHIEKHIIARHSAQDADVRLTRSDYIQRAYPELQMPEHLDLRALTFEVPAKDTFNRTAQAHFLTNLPHSLFPYAKLMALPPLRWNHETLNNDIKSRLGLGHIRSLSPELARREILAHLCLHNLVRLSLYQAQPHAPLTGSFTAALSALRQANQQLRMAPQLTPQILNVMRQMILAQPLNSRPHRTEPRMTRPRRRPYPIFKTTRDEWRQQRKQQPQAEVTQ
jgi:hypothetical protein